MFITSNIKTNNKKKPIDNKNDFKKENNNSISDPGDLDVLPSNINSENSKLSNYESEVLEELKSIRKVSKNILKTLKKMRI
jgi:hypothetical protein